MSRVVVVLSLCVGLVAVHVGCEDKAKEPSTAATTKGAAQTTQKAPGGEDASSQEKPADKDVQAGGASGDVAVKGGGTAVVDKAPEGAPPTEWFACTADTDCEAVQVGCCDHCNGGKIVALNTTHKAAALADPRVKENCNSAPACTEMACAPHVAACKEGKCVSSPDPNWGK